MNKGFYNHPIIKQQQQQGFKFGKSSRGVKLKYFNSMGEKINEKRDSNGDCGEQTLELFCSSVITYLLGGIS